MATIFSNLFSINGVVSTDKSVLQNLNTLCTASGCWLTFDDNTGLWSVIINSTGSSVKPFTDANIIGAINISGSGINELYNKVSIEFPHVDLRDQTDYIDMRIPTEQLYPNELENILNIKLDCINNPLQAQQIATQELKQSRVDKIIEFRTDFTSLGLKAGDLIDITSAVYGYTNKMFRIVRMTEEDGDDGTLYVSITALEYDPDVYSNTGLVREERQKKTGIIPKSQNTALTSLDNQATGQSMIDSLALPAILASLLSALRPNSSGYGMISQVYTNQVNALYIAPILGGSTYNLGYSIKLPYTGRYKLRYYINWGGTGSPFAEWEAGFWPKNGVWKTSSIYIPGKDLGQWAATGDACVPLYEDHFIEGFFSGIAGESVPLYLTAETDWPTTYVWINFDLTLVG